MSRPPVSLRAAAEVAATGDLWLFRGNKYNDRFVRVATNSPVNHVAMTVALDDLPPLLWHTESSPSSGDVWTGDRHSGVQLQLLEQAVSVWGDRWSQRPFLRQLSPPISSRSEDELLRVINELSGRRFPSARGLAKRWLAGRARRSLPQEEVFCAELIALTYQRMGLLDTAKPPNWYDAGRFGSGDRLVLMNDAVLGPEIEIAVQAGDTT